MRNSQTEVEKCEGGLNRRKCRLVEDVRGRKHGKGDEMRCGIVYKWRLGTQKEGVDIREGGVKCRRSRLGGGRGGSKRGNGDGMRGVEG